MVGINQSHNNITGKLMTADTTTKTTKNTANAKI
jgi:hypothetical protein